VRGKYKGERVIRALGMEREEKPKDRASTATMDCREKGKERFLKKMQH